MITPAVSMLKALVVTPADHFPSRAHVLRPALFSQLLHSTFCTGEVFVPCRQPAAAFRAHMLTTIPARIQRQYDWGLRLQAPPLPTARILPKPSKGLMKARAIVSFFRTRAAPLLTLFGALIFELTKITFPHIPGQLSVQDLIQQLWDALSNADPEQFVQLISQDLSGFFTSILVERFHQALQVLLHQYDLKVGLQNVSHWSVFEIKSDYRKRIFKGKWCRMTKIPRVFHAEDLQLLLDFVIASSHFDIWIPLSSSTWSSNGITGCPTPLQFSRRRGSIKLCCPYSTAYLWHERDVDNRFILLRSSADPSAILDNFLSLEFYRPPVMLETQHAQEVLGYNCDSRSRTIAPQLPDHPSQIKGVRSANDDLFTYSSWSSRSWLEANL